MKVRTSGDQQVVFAGQTAVQVSRFLRMVRIDGFDACKAHGLQGH